LITEKQLVKNCQKGIKSSQYELVRRYSPMLMAAAMRFVRDEFKAKDVLQESLIRIFKYLHTYKDTGSFEAWSRRITVRCALTALDKSKIKREMELTEFNVKTHTSPEVLNNFGVEDISKMIEILPIGYRTVFNLSIIEGYSHKEIADLLDIEENTSRSQLSRAKKKLQHYLNVQANPKTALG